MTAAYSSKVELVSFIDQLGDSSRDAAARLEKNRFAAPGTEMNSASAHFLALFLCAVDSALKQLRPAPVLMGRSGGVEEALAEKQPGEESRHLLEPDNS